MKIKLPESIRVADVDVIVEPFPHPDLGTALKSYGEYNGYYQRIRIDLDVDFKQPCTRILCSLLHEITHAIYLNYGIHDEDKEERIVTAMAIAWTQIYRDNPELIKFIAKMTKGK